MSNPNQPFKDAYGILQRNAERLRTDSSVDIDALVPLVEESLQAYRTCKTRIEAVRQALAEQLGPPPEDLSATPDDPE